MIANVAQVLAAAAGDAGAVVFVSRLVEAMSEDLSYSPGESIYEEWNFCSSCRKLYPKEIRSCPRCRHRQRTRPRS